LEHFVKIVFISAVHARWQRGERLLLESSGRVHRVGIALHYVVVDSVLDVRRVVRGAEDAFVVGFMFCEEEGQ
jgi:hypothetical protein